MDVSTNTNPLALALAAQDASAFLSTARAVFPLLALLWIAGLVRWRRPAWLLLGILAANGWAFLETNLPLQRVYALGVSSDRVHNLGMCQVVAAGNSPFETWQVGQTHFELHGRPHNATWVLLVAALSGFDPDRVFLVYAVLPALLLAAVVLAFYFGMAPPCNGIDVSESDPAWSRWERVVVAGFVTLLASAPMDSTGPYAVPWATMFLLKPNHALGLVVLPLLLGGLGRTIAWRGRVVSAALFLALGAVFLLHAVYAVAGLLGFLLLTWRLRPADLRHDARDVASVLALAALVLAPVALALLARVEVSELPGRLAALSGRASLPGVAHYLEPFARVSPLSALALLGAWTALRRGDRLGRLLVGQLLAAVAIWAAYPLLSHVGWAEQPDEAFQWLRFLLAASAGVGAWELAGRASRALRARALDRPALRAAAMAVVLLPFSLPYWWDPSVMDRYFPGSREPLPRMLREAGEFLRHRTEPQAVLAGDPYFARWAAALGGRRSLSSMGLPQPSDLEERGAAERTLLRSDDAAEVRAAAGRYGVRLLVVTPLMVSAHAVTPEAVAARGFWRPLVRLDGERGDFVALFELVS